MVTCKLGAFHIAKENIIRTLYRLESYLPLGHQKSLSERLKSKAESPSSCHEIEGPVEGGDDVS